MDTQNGDHISYYIVVMVYLTFLGMERVYLHALVPAMGYFLSTLSLSLFKKMWLENIYKKENAAGV